MYKQVGFISVTTSATMYNKRESEFEGERILFGVNEAPCFCNVSQPSKTSFRAVISASTSSSVL